MNITEPLLLIVGLEIGIFAVVWCAALVLRHFSPRIYAAHICAEVDNTIPQRCFDCSEAACEGCEFYTGSALSPEKTRSGSMAAARSC